MTMQPLAHAPHDALARVQAVLTDIDDTLTLHGRLPAEAFDALWKLRRAGIKVIPITGRPAGWCDLIARQWPVDGVVGELLKAQHRQHFRPAHLHTLIYKPGLKTLISQVYVSDDPVLDNDPQFGVTRRLVGNFVRHDEPGPTPDVQAPWYSLDYRFVMEEGETRLPRPPIR